MWRDISVTIKSGMVHWPGDPAVSIRRIKDRDKGAAANLSLISMGSHTGTHIDAPSHFIPKGPSIDNISLDAMIGPARVIEVQDRECIKEAHLRKCRIRCKERILFKTRNSQYRSGAAFKKNFVYISLEAAHYLAAKGVRAVGIDYLSVGGYYKDGVQVHQVLLGGGICVIEGLNLSQVQPGNYDLICLPLKILNGDGAPARAIIQRRVKR
jgi:arylformamidase